MSDNIQLTLFIPDLLMAAQVKSLPGLARLLGKADVATIPLLPMQERLFELFDFPMMVPPPIAALTALGDGLASQAGEWWLRVDPAEMQADQATVYLLATEHFDLTDAETSELLATLNPLLQQDGLQLLASNPQRWYLKLPEEPGMQTIAPEQLLGKSIKSYLSLGERQAYWRRLFSELQFLLYQHPVNQRRQRQNKPLINGVWFWGEGCLPELRPIPKWSKVWTDSILVKGLASWSQIEVAALPQQFSEKGQQWPSGEHLVLPSRVSADDIEQWDIQWFQRLLTALKTKQIDQLTLYTEQQCFRLNHQSVRRWWRRHYKF